MMQSIICSRIISLIMRAYKLQTAKLALYTRPEMHRLVKLVMLTSPKILFEF